MSNLVRKTLSIVAAIGIVISSIAIWFYIEIEYDGCCGAPQNYTNDSSQSLSHLAAYLVAVVIIWLVIRWGWKSTDKK